MRGAVTDEPDLGCAVAVDHRLRHVCPRRLELAREAVHVLDIIVRPLAVLAARIVARPAREVRRHPIAGNRAVGNAVAVRILVASPLADLLERLLREHLAPVDRLVRILEAVRHPVVHAEIEIHHHEHRRLEELGEIERLLRHRVALLHRVRNDHDVLGIAV